MLNVRPIKAFQDNYIWCIQNPLSRHCVVVDPGEAKPVSDYLSANNLTLKAILITHHHFDHTGGVSGLISNIDKQDKPIEVYGPANNNIKHITKHLTQNDNISLLGTDFTISEVPGHTLDHIAYFSAPDTTHNHPWLFCGDTLFSGGCGRLFEGAAQQMLLALKGFAEQPANTQVYCTHEYTLANLAFAQAVLPSDHRIKAYLDACQKKLTQGEATLPSTIEQELDINLFLNCTRADVKEAVSNHANIKVGSELEIFAALRSWKDRF